MKKKACPVSKRATALVRQIRRNVEAYYADKVSHATFGKRNRQLWDRIQADPKVHEAALCQLRKR